MKSEISQEQLLQMRALRDAIQSRRASDEARSTTARPISFSDAMINALLAGRKTQTRRLFRKPAGRAHSDEPVRCHLGKIDDQLWVREKWAVADPRKKPSRYVYSNDAVIPPSITWRASFTMPRAASRITLRITDVRSERLQSISEADALAEGFDPIANLYGPLHWFRNLWDELFAEPDVCWAANPWVWVIGFERIR